MAVDIEPAPNASPKLRPQWLVRIKPGTKQGENWFCQVGVGSERIMEIQRSSFNLDEVAEEIFTGMTKAFEMALAGKPGRKFGFLSGD